MFAVLLLILLSPVLVWWVANRIDEPREFRDDHTALLEVEGAPHAGMRVLYIVTMERTDGRWGFASSQWAGILK